MDNTRFQMIREDLTKDFDDLADVHTKAIGNLFEEFNDDQMLLMLDTKWAMNDNSPNQLEATNAWQQEPKGDTRTSTASQINVKNGPDVPTKNEQDVSTAQERLSAPQPDLVTTPKEEIADPNHTEGILDILNED